MSKNSGKTVSTRRPKLGTIDYQTIRIGLDEATGLGRFYLPVFILLIANLIGIMVFKMIKIKASD